MDLGSGKLQRGTTPRGTSMKERATERKEIDLEGGFGGKPLKNFFCKIFKFSPKIFTRNFNSPFIHRILTRNFFSENFIIRIFL